MHSKLQKLIDIYAIQHLVNFNFMSNLTVEIKGRRHRHKIFLTPLLKIG